MEKKILGLHHITALTADAQANLDFYAGILGLRLVKKTINFDAPDVYHLYYGDETGTPGTILTFFPIKALSPGRKGTGQLTVTSFAIPVGSISYWLKRLDHFHIEHKEPQVRYGDEAFIYLEDYEGLGLELVEVPNNNRRGWGNIVPAEYAITGFHGILLNEVSFEKTAALLTHQMNYKLIKEQGNRMRFSTGSDQTDFVDILYNGSIRALSGNGTIHHVAFAVTDDHSQQLVRERLNQAGMSVTPVIDRNYFHSVYFREPGGVLFEIATSDIGFTIDEPPEKLGTSLKLPKWAETDRRSIEAKLGEIRLEFEKFLD